MLTRLIYASEIDLPLDPAGVQEILDTARCRNPLLNLTGMLAFDKHAFLQVLEGERAAVSTLFCRIAADRRHHALVLLEATPVHERHFASWSMGYAAADAKHAGLYMRFGGSPRFEPRSLTAPAALGLLRALVEAGERMRLDDLAGLSGMGHADPVCVEVPLTMN